MNGDEVAHAIHRSHEQHAAKLEEIRKLLEGSVLQISLGGTPNDRLIYDNPIPGINRYSLSDRRISGNDNLVIPAQTTPATLVAPALPGRLGGSIVNIGANPCFVYAADLGRVVYQAGGIFTMWLVATGGSWDYRMGNALWDGPVVAISPLGTTLVWGQA